eukprot:TRINITY_DN20273_c0_g1_i12.p1 TRINITY_DN20273_c0_g1~~TRINITY_DN20273_c0_g1_i12.p1  ORF type:complete len:142 (-),score=13.27 TRINITY_DN20273_c0_g1_i12:9-434(-)
MARLLLSQVLKFCWYRSVTCWDRYSPTAIRYQYVSSRFIASHTALDLSPLPLQHSWIPLRKCTKLVWSSITSSTTALTTGPVSYTHLRAHETPEHLVCRLLLEKKKKKNTTQSIYCQFTTNLTDYQIISLSLSNSITHKPT